MGLLPNGSKWMVYNGKSGYPHDLGNPHMGMSCKVSLKIEWQMVNRCLINTWLILVRWLIDGCQMALSMFLRDGLVFGTRVLKTRVPERAFWADPFPITKPKFMYFLGLDTETFFSPNKKGFRELLWVQNGGWSHQKVDLPNSGSFFGWSKKGSGLTRFVGRK